MMRLYTLVLCAVAVNAATLPEVLQKIDVGGPKFAAMTADVTKLAYTKVIDDKSTESGVIAIRRKGKDLQVKIEFTKPDQRFVTLRGQKAEIYTPKTATVQEIDLGKQSDMIGKVLLVGLGTTKKDLQANYEIVLVGEETVAGRKTFHLDLTPKASGLKKQFQKLEVWMADDGSLPVQQKVILPAGDYTMFTYSKIRYNPALNDDALVLQLPKNVKREFPQRGN